MKFVATVGMSAAVALLAGSAFAQGAAVGVSGSADVGGAAAAPAPAPAPEPTPAPPPDATAAATTAPESSAVTLPSAAPATGDSDHSQMVGRFAIGYMGTQTMPLGTDGVVNATNTVTAPIIGGRYWLDNMIGIDAGLGFLWSTGSTEDAQGVPPGTKTDNADITAFLLHVGVPLNLADAGHFSFQVIPEANVGFSGAGDLATGPTEVNPSGFMINAGARAGAEIQFGFIGIPQLSLTGSIGLFLQHTSGKTEYKDAAGNKVDDTLSRTSISTTLGPNPWNLFTGNISALYYL